MAAYGEIPDFRHRLIEDAGGGFVIGAAGGSAFHFVRGLRHSPSGGRVAGAVRAVRANAPRVAGSLAAFMALSAAFESSISILARRREDTLTFIPAGAATNGLLNMRRGAATAARYALFGATSFAVIDGLLWTIRRWLSRRISDRDGKIRMDRGLPLLAPVATAPPRTAHEDPALDFASLVQEQVRQNKQNLWQHGIFRCGSTGLNASCC